MYIGIYSESPVFYIRECERRTRRFGRFASRRVRREASELSG